MLACDTTNLDTHLATTTPGELARRGHAKSKRRDLRVVGLATLVSETGHVPLWHRTYPGNGSDQTVPGECWNALGKRHDAGDDGDPRPRPGCRTLVRDGGSWREPLELDWDAAGDDTLIALPVSHSASQVALERAAHRGVRKHLGGKLGGVRAARLRTAVGDAGWDRTLVVVESQELLRGPKRGIAVALGKAQLELRQLERRAASGRMPREALEVRVQKARQREHLSDFVTATGKESRGPVSLHWHVDAARRRLLERTRRGRRVLGTDHHNWSNGRIVHAFRDQWNVEELFRRAKKGGIAPWGPSHQWADHSLRLHTFATVIGLTLVSLGRRTLGNRKSAKSTRKTLSDVKATLVRVRRKARGRRATAMLVPDVTAEQRKAIQIFELDRWVPTLLSSMTQSASSPDARPAA